MRTGDLIATGTLSGPTRKELGCFLELSWNGRREYEVEGLEEEQGTIKRHFLKDGDIIEFEAIATSPLGRVGFGTYGSQVLPAKDIPG